MFTTMFPHFVFVVFVITLGAWATGELGRSDRESRDGLLEGSVLGRSDRESRDGLLEDSVLGRSDRESRDGLLEGSVLERSDRESLDGLLEGSVLGRSDRESRVGLLEGSVLGRSDRESRDGLLEGSVLGRSDRELILQLLDTVTSLQKQNEVQLVMMEAMQTQMQQQNQVIAAMGTRIQRQEGQRYSPITTLDKLPVKENRVTRTVTPADKQIKEDAGSRTTRQSSAPTVAFTAVATNSVSHYGAAGRNILFKKVEVNLANGYDPSTGVFTAPSAGVYVISASILSVANRETSCDIVVNGNARARLYARGTDDRHDQGSQTVSFRLEKGDVISVQNEASDDAVHGGLYTSFSGFLLPEFYDVSNIIG